jgi:hypothetical protein
MLQEFRRCIREVSGAIVGINVDDNDSEPDAYDPETPQIRNNTSTTIRKNLRIISQ